MKVVGRNARSVTLRISRAEFDTLLKAVGMTIYMLVGASDGTLQLKDDEVRIGAVFLPKIQGLFKSVAQIAIENGWLDEDEDE